jgi:Cof subfamily protein (haloacid dehalogenase superfamily)
VNPSAQEVRLLALDIDGTLLNSRGEISVRNLLALAAAREAGVRLALITGRRYPAAKRIADRIPGNLTLVLHNGGLVMENGETLRVLPLARDVAISVVSFAKARGADPVVHCGQSGEGLLYVENSSPSHTLLAYYLTRSHPDVRLVKSLEGFLEGEGDDPLQVMFGGSMTDMELLCAAIESEGFQATPLRTVYPKDDLSLIDVVAPAVDKSEALAFLCARWSIPMAGVLAVGDNWNDRSMLLAAGVGCVMANADMGLHSLGLEVVPTNDDDGVAVAIERHILRSVAAK